MNSNNSNSTAVAEFIQEMKDLDKNTIPTTTSGTLSIYTTPRRCPTCGTCPTCGSRTSPWNPWTYPSYPTGPVWMSNCDAP